MAGAFYNNWNGSNYSDSTISGGYSSGMSANTDAATLYNMTDAQRKTLAQMLKNAGYKVPVNGKYSDNLLQAYNSASMKAALQSQMIGKEFTVRDFLTQEAAATIAAGSSKGPSVSKQVRISTTDQAADVINKVFRDLTGRGASAAELKKYTKLLQTEQKKPAAAITTKYATVGDVQTATTTGGIDNESFLIEQLAGTDEAQANKVFNYYNAFKNAIGVM